ncbi:transcription initiation factor TFIID subunit 8 [Nematocida minor]|uniref:transcription initiation factor TFIID subunit 8 n=1 Tax=Nematocida minor TaxID=1912983 RepID=UPI002221110E|nr:transcription initiation factor TFIID subunit 8 [Nematocida minor]KAI5190210.1 transcription initiation factor TFIID subunit 8 [Nematocida minor]
MESIKEAMKAAVASILKEEGFTSVESKGMDILTEALLNYTVYTGNRLKRQAEMSRRTLPTLVDASIIIQEINSQNLDQSTRQESKHHRNNHSATNSSYNGVSLGDLLNLYNTSKKIDPIKIVMQETEDAADCEFASDACTYVDYPQNYYEFFPKFPPAHTFKNSSIKRKITDDRAQKARLRNEQTKKVVENLFTIMAKSGKSPKYANYLL